MIKIAGASLLAALLIVDARALFDGRTLAGWEGDARTFRVEQGSIVGGTLAARVPRNEFLCTTRSYSDFVLRLKFKVLGQGANAGIQIRSARIPNHHEVVGYQADLGDGWWGSLYDESRRNKTLAKPDPAALGAALRREDWNEYEIHAEGRRIRLAINGQPTVDYTEPDAQIPQTGVICLQIHGGPPSEAWYKEIIIEEIKR
jgi:3-keto-disaccharide hydrolase